MTTSLPSVSTFTDPSVTAPSDRAQQPAKAAAYWLRRDIVRGVFEPLARLKSAHLSSFYGVGTTPAREAILLLSATGLVTHEPLKGYRVAPVSLHDYDDVLAVYHRLYKTALGMAIELGDEAWEERVVVQLHRSAKVPVALPTGDPEAREKWQRAYGEFHGQLLSGCGSDLMMQMLGDIGVRAERYVNLFAHYDAAVMRDHNAEHRAIAEAVVARDKDRALALIDRYFATAQPMRDSIIEVLRRKEQAKPRRRAANTNLRQSPQAAE